jgi:hypothetical protein
MMQDFADVATMSAEAEAIWTDLRAPAGEGDMGIAAQTQRNLEYYRGLVIRCGQALGEEAYTADDGTKMEDVLCDKVPELVEALARREPELAMLVARLAHQLNRADPHNLLSHQARDYLRRHGLDGTPIRDEA